MGRQTFQIGNLSVVVGWDNPCQSFFAQVKGEVEDPAQTEALLPFRNMGFGADLINTVSTLEELRAALNAAGITIPDDTAQQLLRDQGCSKGPNTTQRRNMTWTRELAKRAGVIED